MRLNETGAEAFSVRVNASYFILLIAAMLLHKVDGNCGDEDHAEDAQENDSGMQTVRSICCKDTG